jgi:selenocysteine lyase/cysteine desulfurase
MSTSDDEKVAELRKLIPATGAGIYLATARSGPLPAETAAAMTEADEWELRVGRAWDGRIEDVIQRHEEARAVMAALIGASVDEIVVAPSFEAAGDLVRSVLDVWREDYRHLVAPSNGELWRPSSADEGLAVVDASLAVGAIPVVAAQLNAEAVVFAADRWLLGPEGIACVWFPRASYLKGLSVARTQLIGLARSVGWLEMYVGLDWAFERTRQLAERLHGGLSLDGVDVLTPLGTLAAIVSFRLPAWPIEAALDELRRRSFAILESTPDESAIRASVAWFNTEEEIDRFAEAVAELARYTPETLPRKPTLLVH